MLRGLDVQRLWSWDSRRILIWSCFSNMRLLFLSSSILSMRTLMISWFSIYLLCTLRILPLISFSSLRCLRYSVKFSVWLTICPDLLVCLDCFISFLVGVLTRFDRYTCTFSRLFEILYWLLRTLVSRFFMFSP
jgi:hypothetical protein